MKSSEKEPDYQRAYEILELPPNASREALEQAYRDLREVWNPERFQTDERLNRRAEEQLVRIEEAYQLLKGYHSRRDPLLEELYGKPKKTRSSPHVPMKTDSQSVAAPPSLLDSVFADSAPGPAKRFPLTLVVVGIVIVVVLAIVFISRSGGDSAPATPKTTVPAAETPPPAEQSPPPAPAQGLPVDVAQTAPPLAAAAGSETPDQTPVQPRKPEEPSASASRSTVRSQPGARARSTDAPKPNAPSTAPPPRTETDTKPELVRGPEEGGVAPEEERRVLNVLGQKSPAAQRILDGNTDQFRVMSWRVTRKDGGEFWAHVVAQTATGVTVHLIWAVDPAKQTIRPMSQSARDLDKPAAGNASTGS